MATGWQDLAALGVVLAAVGYLARSLFGSLSGSNSGGCGGGGCSRCPSQRDVRPGKLAAQAPANLITLDAIKPVEKSR